MSGPLHFMHKHNFHVSIVTDCTQIFIARYSYGWWGEKTAAAQDPEAGRPVLLLPAGDHEAALRVPGLPDTGGQSGGLQLAQVGDGSKRILKLWCIVIYDCFVGRSQSMVPGLVMELLVLRPLQSQSKRYKLIIKYCWVTLHQLTFFWRNINVYFTESKCHLESDSSWELYFLSWLEFSHVRFYGILSSCCQ